jgi:hypothetical protein
MALNQLKWVWGTGVLLSVLFCQGSWAAESCPAAEYRHASRPISFMISRDSTPIFKAAARFEVSGAEFLEISADAGGIYLENQAGEVGLPVHVLRVMVTVDGQPLAPSCRHVALFPGQRLLWAKWPASLQQIIDDREFVMREPVRAEASVESYR